MARPKKRKVSSRDDEDPLDILGLLKRKNALKKRSLGETCNSKHLVRTKNIGGLKPKKDEFLDDKLIVEGQPGNKFNFDKQRLAVGKKTNANKSKRALKKPNLRKQLFSDDSDIEVVSTITNEHVEKQISVDQHKVSKAKNAMKSPVVDQHSVFEESNVSNMINDAEKFEAIDVDKLLINCKDTDNICSKVPLLEGKTDQQTDGNSNVNVPDSNDSLTSASYDTPQKYLSMLNFEVPNTPPSSCHFSVSEILTPLTSPTPSRNKHQDPEPGLNNSDILIKDKDVFFKRKPKIQYQLNFLSMQSKKITCKECFMSYMSNVKQDGQLHKQYHHRYLEGLNWNDSWGRNIAKKEPPVKVQIVKSSSLVQKYGYIREVNLGQKSQANVILNLLKMINNELNAPDDWLTALYGSSLERFDPELAIGSGKVFVYIYNRKVIGLVSLENIEESNNRPKIMDVDTQSVWVLNPNSFLFKKMPKALYGISRIFVLKKFRRNNIALILLYTSLNELVYGMKLNKYQLSWSQPSFAGLKLARKFNLITDARSKQQFLNVYFEGE